VSEWASRGRIHLPSGEGAGKRGGASLSSLTWRARQQEGPEDGVLRHDAYVRRVVEEDLRGSLVLWQPQSLGAQPGHPLIQQPSLARNRAVEYYE
jgi:esterase/lipase superfamily enzyme